MPEAPSTLLGRHCATVSKEVQTGGAGAVQNDLRDLAAALSAKRLALSWACAAAASTRAASPPTLTYRQLVRRLRATSVVSATMSHWVSDAHFKVGCGGNAAML